MAEILNSGFAMGSAIRQETSEFISLDIENLDKDSIPNSSPRVIKNYSRKGSMKLGAENQKAAAEGEFTALAMNGGAHSLEKHAVSVQVARAEEPVSVSHVTTPTSAGTKYRRLGSRRASPPWLNPRRVLFAFATLSSMGTLILLYFTLSMGKMSGADADAR